MKPNQVNLIRIQLALVVCAFGLTALPLSAQPETNDVVTITNATDVAVPVSEAITKVDPEGQQWSRRRGGDNAKVVIGNDYELREGDTADAVVVIGGNARVKGKVHDAAVVIGGNLDVSGEVGGAAVTVMGSLNVQSNAVIDGDAVAVMGSLNVASNAAVQGNAVAVGGELNVADPDSVQGETQFVDFPAIGLPELEWMGNWFKHCVFKLRPLAPQVGWVWLVAGAFFLFYLVVAATLPRPVQSCVGELTRRPVTSFFLGVLTLPLALIVCLILLITVIGGVVVLFLVPALFVGALIGKVALLEYLGDSIRRATGAAQAFSPLVALLVGALLLTVLYLIPVLGLLTFTVTGLWGLGAAVSATFGGMKRENPEKPAAPAAMTPAPAATSGFAPAPMPVTAAPTVSAFASNPIPAASAEANPGAQPFTTAPAVTPATTGVPEALAYPRAGFWERMGAAFLDMVLVGILIGVASNLPGPLGHPPIVFLVALAYFAGMWAWKGTTVGGIVLGLKVARLDNQPVTFLVALVRGLAAAFSMVVFFLGFLWIAWDPEKQGWHDRIAGTVVIRMPRGTPLVVL